MKKIVYTIITIILCLSATLWYGCKEDMPGEIHGDVTDKATGEPIKSASVEIQPIGQRLMTGTDGRYGFNELEPGTYKLYVTKTGYEDCLSGEILLKSGQSIPQNVPMEKLPPALRIVNDKRENVDSLDFGVDEDDVMRSFNIFNEGSVTLQWQVTSAADWIANISKENGELNAGDLQTVIVKIDRKRLKEGENKTTIHITSNDGSAKLLVKARGRSRPVVNTLDATEVKRTSAIFHGELINVGVPTYFERGFVYSLSTMPTMENTISKLSVVITEDLTFQATATNLENMQTYYIRAYAINEVGIAYSPNEVKCIAQKALPEVQTQSVTDVTEHSATLSGIIKSVGDPAYTERGFIYGTMPEPSFSVSGIIKCSVAGSEEGAYTANISNLIMGTTYYVRAYAKVGENVAYGAILNFKTTEPPYVVLETEKLMVQKEDLGNVTWAAGYTLCQNSTLAGFTDWRLPTRDELISLYLKKDEIGGVTGSASYWSGTWCDENGTFGPGHQDVYPIYVDFKEGTSYYDPNGQHGTKRKVRAVRTITK